MLQFFKMFSLRGKKFEKLVFSSSFLGSTSLDFTSVILFLLTFHCDKRKKLKEKPVFHD